MEYGASSLSDAEVLALFMGSGSRGMSAITLSERLIRVHGSLSSLGSLLIDDLSKEKGIGQAKASRLVAAFELATRVAREQCHGEILDSPDAIYRSFGPQLQHLPHEQVMVASLDCRLRHLSSHLISMGSVNESIAHPRDILRPVISRGAHGFILVHNHPSGDPTPSRADQDLTHRILQAAEMMQLRFVDHLIVGRANFGQQPWYSYRKDGRIFE